MEDWKAGLFRAIFSSSSTSRVKMHLFLSVSIDRFHSKAVMNEVIYKNHWVLGITYNITVPAHVFLHSFHSLYGLVENRFSVV